MTDTLRIIELKEDTVVDGPGFRSAVYCAGCAHRCPGCHNPESWGMDAGRDVPLSELLEVILANDHANVTFTGGDPLLQVEGFTSLARMIKQRSSKDIWCYTGFLFEQVVASEQLSKILPYIDVLVDGPFVEALKDDNLLLRGSSNQRLVNVPASLAGGRTVLFPYDPFPRI